jgi:hypothetical protein
MRFLHQIHLPISRFSLILLKIKQLLNEVKTSTTDRKDQIRLLAIYLLENEENAI